MNITDLLEDSLDILSDSRVFLHLVILWAVSVVFCWKVFPLICSSKEAPAVSEGKDLLMSPPPAPSRTPNSQSPHMTMMRSPVTPSSLNHTMRSPSTVNTSRMNQSMMSPNMSILNSTKTSKDSKFLSLLEGDVCQKAKEAGKHPSYSGLVVSLVHHYNLDINKPVLSKRLTIFHCACLSGNLELVSSLSPLAELSQTTGQGETPLYLAVYAAGHRLAEQPQGEQEGLEVVRHLLQAGSGSHLNSPNTAGLTALHQAKRRGHTKMIRSVLELTGLDINQELYNYRLLLDWGAETVTGQNTTISVSTRETTRGQLNVTTRSMSRRLLETTGTAADLSHLTPKSR